MATKKKAPAIMKQSKAKLLLVTLLAGALFAAAWIATSFSSADASNGVNSHQESDVPTVDETTSKFSDEVHKKLDALIEESMSDDKPLEAKVAHSTRGK